MTVRILHGDCREVLRMLAPESVHTIVTSPPYWGLRDYGIEPVVWGGEAICAHDWRDAPGQFCRRCSAWRGTLGLEPTIDLYVEHAVEVFRGVRRVLRKDGTCWMNLGDAYAHGKPVGGSVFDNGRTDGRKSYEGDKVRGREKLSTLGDGLKPKDLCGVPWRVAFALQADGWWLRQDIIWHKPNPMPESVTDRCTKAHEYIFLLSRSERYFFDAEAIKEPASQPLGRAKLTGQHKADAGGFTTNGHGNSTLGSNQGAETRNKRSVWTIASEPFPDAHFATFPPALVEPCILAGCPKGGTVLDPFLGSGTTALVADRLQRDCIGIEMNHEYAMMAHNRMVGEAPLFADIKTN